jgi:hypothetical protein
MTKYIDGKLADLYISALELAINSLGDFRDELKDFRDAFNNKIRINDLELAIKSLKDFRDKSLKDFRDDLIAKSLK